MHGVQMGRHENNTAIKRIRIDFISRWQVSVVIGRFVKQVFKRTMALAITYMSVRFFS